MPKSSIDQTRSAPYVGLSTCVPRFPKLRPQLIPARKSAVDGPRRREILQSRDRRQDPLDFFSRVGLVISPLPQRQRRRKTMGQRSSGSRQFKVLNVTIRQFKRQWIPFWMGRKSWPTIIRLSSDPFCQLHHPIPCPRFALFD